MTLLEWLKLNVPSSIELVPDTQVQLIVGECSKEFCGLYIANVLQYRDESCDVFPLKGCVYYDIDDLLEELSKVYS